MLKLPEQAPAPALGRPLVYRQVSLSLEAFDRLKAWQRALERRWRRRMTNGEVLDHVLLASRSPPG